MESVADPRGGLGGYGPPWPCEFKGVKKDGSPKAAAYISSFSALAPYPAAGFRYCGVSGTYSQNKNWNLNCIHCTVKLIEIFSHLLWFYLNLIFGNFMQNLAEDYPFFYPNTKGDCVIENCNTSLSYPLRDSKHYFMFSFKLKTQELGSIFCSHDPSLYSHDDTCMKRGHIMPRHPNHVTINTPAAMKTQLFELVTWYPFSLNTRS